MGLIHDFHFLRPLWLFALPLLWLLVYWLARRRRNDGDWSGLIDAELLPALQLDAGRAAGMRPWPLLALLWTIGVLALAGPSWERNQTTAFRIKWGLIKHQLIELFIFLFDLAVFNDFNPCR